MLKIFKKEKKGLHYNESNSFFFANALKIYQFNPKDSETKSYPFCLGNIPKDFTIDNMEKTELKEILKVLSINYNTTDTNDFLDIHGYLIKKTRYKVML